MTNFAHELVHGTVENGIPIFPPWWTGDRIKTVVASFGAQLDAMSEQSLYMRLQSIVFAGGPNATRQGAARLADGRLIECEPFALPAHADQRGLTLYDTEPTLSRRIRLASYLDLHRERGTELGILHHVRPYFATAAAYPVLWLVHRTGTGKVVWHGMSAAGKYSISLPGSDNFDYDTTNRRSRWFAFIELPGSGFSTGDVWNGGQLWDDGWQYDSQTVSTAIALVSMLADWAGAHMWLAAVWLVWQAGTVGPTITPTQDPAGWWSLPGGSGAGSWVNPVGRPPYITAIMENPPP